MKKKYNTPEPATKEQKKFFRECLEVINGQVFWKSERPEYHFKTKGYKKLWLERNAGKRAGRLDGNNRRITFNDQNNDKINRSEAWFIKAITGEKPKKVKKFGMPGVMAAMNKSLMKRYHSKF